MLKQIFNIIITCSPLLVFSQIGNSNNHQGPLHIDAKNNNNTSSTPSTTEALDDVIVTADGKLGIGKIDPETKVEISSGTTGKSGLRLTQITANSTPYYKEAGLLGVDTEGNVVGRTNTVPPPCVPTYIHAFGDNLDPNPNPSVENLQNVILPNFTSDPNSNSSYSVTTGVFNLKKGVTYQLEASIFNSYQGTTNSYFSYEWYFIDNNTVLSFQTLPRASVLQNTASPGYNTIQPYLIAMYTPTANVDVAVRFKDRQGATTQTYAPKYSYISVRQINPCQDTGL